MATRRYEVTAGPSKFDLMLAVFEGKVVSFTLKGVTGLLPAYVTGIAQYSHKPYSEDDQYRIEGRLVGDKDWQDYIENPDAHVFRGFFDCRTRNGQMDFQAECWRETYDRALNEAEKEQRAIHGEDCEGCGLLVSECTCNENDRDDVIYPRDNG